MTTISLSDITKKHGEESLQHHDETFEDVLAHYGVRGMKWGVRKRRPIGGSGYARDENGHYIVPRVSVGNTQMRLNPHGRLASEDAAKKHVYKQVVRDHGLDALPNADLKHLVDRLNLEANYAKISAGQAPKKGKGRQLIEDTIRREAMAALQGKKGPIFSMVDTVVTANSKSGYTGKRRLKK